MTIYLTEGFSKIGVNASGSKWAPFFSGCCVSNIGESFRVYLDNTAEGLLNTLNL
jgi:hypothetical protein